MTNFGNSGPNLIKIGGEVYFILTNSILLSNMGTGKILSVRNSVVDPYTVQICMVLSYDLTSKIFLKNKNRTTSTTTTTLPPPKWRQKANFYNFVPPSREGNCSNRISLPNSVVDPLFLLLRLFASCLWVVWIIYEIVDTVNSAVLSLFCFSRYEKTLMTVSSNYSLFFGPEIWTKSCSISSKVTQTLY